MQETKEVKPKKHEPGFPKWKYHKSGKAKIIESKAAEDLLGAEWKASPADHGQPAHPYSDEQLAEMELVKECAADLSAHVEHKEEKPRGRKNAITLE